MKTYYYNKSLLVLISSLSVILLIGLIGNALFQRNFGIAEMLLCLLCLFLLSATLPYLVAAYKHIPALTINKKGIYDHSLGLTLKWKDIQAYKFSRTPISSISVSLSNPEDYLKRIKNPLIRIIKRFSGKHTFNLNISLLTEQDERILDHIEYYDLEFQRTFLESL